QSKDKAARYGIWGQFDYLMWWVKDAQLPIPLVTTGDPNVGFPLVNSAGALGQPSTHVLFGGGNAPFGPPPGMRLTLGAWFEKDHIVGVEGSGFSLQRGTHHFGAGSDATGNPPLYLPAFNVATQGERALAVSDPLRKFTGNVLIGSGLQLWGTELNGILNVWQRPGLRINLLAGLSYCDLSGKLDRHNTSNH